MWKQHRKPLMMLKGVLSLNYVNFVLYFNYIQLSLHKQCKTYENDNVIIVTIIIVAQKNE